MDAAVLQDRIDKAYMAGGGPAYIAPGLTLLRKPLVLRSGVMLHGNGSKHQVTLRAAHNFVGPAVVVTHNWEIASAGNYWNYSKGNITAGQTTYAEEVGLHAGFGVKGILIDGNRRAGVQCGGCYVYGGGFHLEDIGIIDCADHGLWTQCGSPDNSWGGDAIYNYWNMHESYINHIFISRVGKHGVYYRGPNDSLMDNIKVKSWGIGAAADLYHGVLIDTDTKINAGGLTMGRMHTYAGTGMCFKIRSSYVNAQYLYVDTPGTTGLEIAGDEVRIGEVFVINHNLKRTNDTWGVRIYGKNNYIGYLCYRNKESNPTGALHGGALRIVGTGNQIPNGRLYGGGAAVTIKGQAVSINTADYKGVIDW